MVSTHQDVFNMLKTLNLPVAYHHFSSSQTLPFVVFIETGTDNYYAENTVYAEIKNYDIELYFKTKDPSLEKRIERVLIDHGLTWESSQDTWLESENAYQKIYEIGVNING